MNYLRFPVGNAAPGTAVRVDLSGNQAEVMLMDSANFSRFQRDGSGRGFRRVFGTSPMFFTVPSLGSWYVVVIPLGGTTRASVNVARQAV